MLKIIYLIYFYLFSQINAKIIYKGSGDITYYYNIGKDPCKKIDNPGNLSNGDIFENQNKGFPECDIKGKKQLNKYIHNNIIAIPNKMLKTSKDKKRYCGKELLIYINGKKVKYKYPLVVLDGCEECNNNGGIDISTTLLHTMYGIEGCRDGRLGNISTKMEYHIIDKQIIKYPI